MFRPNILKLKLETVLPNKLGEGNGSNSKSIFVRIGLNLSTKFCAILCDSVNGSIGHHPRLAVERYHLSIGDGFNSLCFFLPPPEEMIEFDQRIFEVGGSTTT